MTDIKNRPVVLVTGGAKRIGKHIVSALHQHGFNVVIHYHQSNNEACQLKSELNQIVKDSAQIFKCDLTNTNALPTLVENASDCWGRLDLLINNASTFYPTPVETVTSAQWDDLMTMNVKVPFFLSQHASPHLKKQHGQIINIIDVHADRPLKNYSLYTTAKAGLKMLTQSLAKEMGPWVRVNGISPGIILWADNEAACEDLKKNLINRTALKRAGNPTDIANTVTFLATQRYITGEIIRIDGGRHLQQ